MRTAARWAIAASCAWASGWCGEPAGKTAVVVELFTSEGCSSCPPADRLLERLDRLQPLAEVRIVVLSEHVDYWDGEGWKDPYSSAEWTRRQKDYDQRLGVEGPYTPQAVVDGRWECVGGDGEKLKREILKAARAPKLKVEIESAAGARTVRVEVEPWRGTGLKRGGEIWVAFASDRAEKEIGAGENRGVRLSHVAVVRKLSELGKVDKDAGFHGETAVEAGAGRIIALVQEPETGRVLGAATMKLEDAGIRNSGTMKETGR